MGMKFRQRIAWLMVVMYLGGSFAFVYYIFEINEHYNNFAVDHVQKFHHTEDKDGQSGTVTEKHSLLHSMWCHVIDLPLSFWLLLFLFPYFQIFLMLLAFTRAEPKLHIAFRWPGLVYLKYQKCFGKNTRTIIPTNNAQTKGVSNGHAVLHTWEWFMIEARQTWEIGWLYEMGLVARKPVFGVSVKAWFKPVSSATETI